MRKFLVVRESGASQELEAEQVGVGEGALFFLIGAEIVAGYGVGQWIRFNEIKQAS